MLTFGVSRRKCISTTLRVARSLCNEWYTFISNDKQEENQIEMSVEEKELIAHDAKK